MYQTVFGSKLQVTDFTLTKIHNFCFRSSLGMTTSISEIVKNQSFFRFFIQLRVLEKGAPIKYPDFLLFYQNIRSISLFAAKFQVLVRLPTKAFLNLKITQFLGIFNPVLNSVACGFLENLFQSPRVPMYTFITFHI